MGLAKSLAVGTISAAITALAVTGILAQTDYNNNGIYSPDTVTPTTTINNDNGVNDNAMPSVNNDNTNTAPNQVPRTGFGTL